MKTCLIGAAHWHAASYAAQLARSRHVFAAAADPNLTCAEAVAKPHDARAYADHREMLARERPDFVMALGRHCEMTALAAELVEAGIPFLMEKPMGTDGHALAEVAARAEAKGLYAGATLQYRMSPAVRELVRRQEAGSFGRVISFYFRLFAGGPERYRRMGVPWMLSKKEAGGGPLYNFGPHGIDLFLRLAGEPILSVRCARSHALHGLEIEDFASLTWTTKSGVIGEVQVGYLCPHSAYDTDFSLCTTELLTKDCDLNAGTILLRAGGEVRIDKATGGLSYLEDALERLAGGRPPLVPIGHMAEILRVINLAESQSGG
jgi:predicted dehydrogenase